MSTISLDRGPSRRPIIGAHADHRTSDFFFPRVQSLESRDLPWEKRIGRMHSWLEIGTYAFALLSACVVTLVVI
jgi:hypothetical protein